MNINKIITETINRYIVENVFSEIDKKEDEKPIKQPNNKISDDQLLSQLKNDVYNESAIAQKLYSDHTEEGAQSQYRKKLHNEKNENGYVYKFTPEEMNKLREIVSQMF